MIEEIEVQEEDSNEEGLREGRGQCVYLCV